ncbi:MAG: hypothetical protein ACQESJ_04270 [Bacteroidota bacterium]
MDIENLKGSWNKYASKLRNDGHKGQGELEEILVKRSQKSLRLLRRNFFIEAGLNIFILPVVLFFVLRSDFVIQPFDFIFSALFIGILIAFLIYMYRSYMRIYQYEDTGFQLSYKLNRQVLRLEKFIRNYYKFVYIAYFLGLIFGLSTELPEDNMSIIIKMGSGILFGIVVLFLIVRPLLKLYIKKLYGSHLESLKMCLTELEENIGENSNDYNAGK